MSVFSYGMYETTLIKYNVLSSSLLILLNEFNKFNMERHKCYVLLNTCLLLNKKQFFTITNNTIRRRRLGTGLRNFERVLKLPISLTLRSCFRVFFSKQIKLIVPSIFFNFSFKNKNKLNFFFPEPERYEFRFAAYRRH